MKPRLRRLGRWLWRLPVSGHHRRLTGAQLADAAVVVILIVGAVAPLQPVYGATAMVWPVVVGLALGLVVALLAATRRWRPLPLCAVAVVIYLAAGGLFAPSGLAWQGWLPNLAVWRWLAAAAVTIWSNLMTVAVPVGIGGGFGTAPFLAALVAALGGVSLAVRLTGLNRAWALAFPLAVWAMAMVECAAHSFHPGLFGLVWALLAVVWLAWRSGHLQPRRIVALTVIAAGCIGGAAAAAWPTANRLVLRQEVEPPFNLRDLTSPLSTYRHYVKDKELREQDLLRVVGLPPGAVVRMAAMDRYDGVVWNVAGDDQLSDSGQFQRVGQTVSQAGAAPVSDIQFDVLDQDSIWVYLVAPVSRIDIAGPDGATLHEKLRFNQASETAALPDGAPSSWSYTVQAVRQAVPSEQRLTKAKAAAVTLPEAQNVPAVVKITAAQYVSQASSDGAIALALEAGLRNDGYFSHGQASEAAAGFSSLAGHGAGRIEQLLTATLMVGDAEQYASAMALMARSFGLPARVVMGFAPNANDRPAVDSRTEITTSADVVTFRGEDMTAWVEIKFEGLGWVPFFPTPNQDKVPQKQEEQQEPEPRPQVIQPPPPQEKPSEPPDEDREAPDTRQTTQDPPVLEAGTSNLIWLRWVGLGAAALAVALGLPLASIILIKGWRRRHRARRGPPLARVVGAWSEVLDTARDLHYQVPNRATRQEISQILTDQVEVWLVHPDRSASAKLWGLPTFGQGLSDMAAAADRAVFAAGDPDAAQAAAAWQAVVAAAQSLRTGRSRWDRLRATASLRSLRRTKDRQVPRRARSRSAFLGKRSTLSIFRVEMSGTGLAG